VAAGVASTPQEALRKETAPEVSAQLVLDVPRQAAVVVLAGVGEERFQVLAYKVVQNGLGRATRKVRGGEHGHEPAFAPRMPGRNAAQLRDLEPRGPVCGQPDRVVDSRVRAVHSRRAQRFPFSWAQQRSCARTREVPQTYLTSSPADVSIGTSSMKR
jgi:hypothetical protein